MLPAAIQYFTFREQQIGVNVPIDGTDVESVHSPYWAKVWPAAVGLCDFLQNNLHYVQHKVVTELAAGLGLPSLFTAKHATKVYCSDIEPAAITLIKESAKSNDHTNLYCTVADWNQLPTTNNLPEVLLLSDVNYEPQIFEELLMVLHFYLNNEITIIVSTPQRLMAKPFIEKLLPYCKMQDEVAVTIEGQEVLITILVLKS